MPGKESKLQKRVLADLKRRGWLVNKIILCGINGWPDLQILKGGKWVHIEMKAPSKKAEPLQKYVHAQIREHGGIVYTINSWQEYLDLKKNL